MITKEDVGREVSHQLHGFGVIEAVDVSNRLVHVYFYGMEEGKDAERHAVHPISLSLVTPLTAEELDEAERYEVNRQELEGKWITD